MMERAVKEVSDDWETFGSGRERQSQARTSKIDNDSGYSTENQVGEGEVLHSV